MSKRTKGNVFRIAGMLIIALFVVQMVAFADDISNDLDNTVDATLETLGLTAGGADGTTQLRVIPTNGDGKNGCNLTGGTLLTVSVSSSDTSVATVSPALITFTSCGDTSTITVTPKAEGTADVTLSLVENTTDGSFNLAPAAFTVNVAAAAPSDTTAPVIDYTLTPAMPDGDNGWYRSDVTLIWSVIEDESESSLMTIGCVDQNITEDQGETTYSCSATSDGGSSGPVEVTIKRDATAPDVAVTGVVDNAIYYLGAVPPAGCDTTDATSGVATSATLAITGGNANGTGRFSATCDGADDNAGNDQDAPVVVTYGVVYEFDGFFGPLAKKATAKAGSAIPVQFSLNGDQGLDIFMTGFPKSRQVSCASEDVGDQSEVSSVNPGSSSISYDAMTDTYNYVWKTEKSWGGTCRTLELKFNDGKSQYVTVEFKK